VQLVFVALNVWIGAQFYLWVRSFEGSRLGWVVSRPAGVDGWLPIAGLMNLRYLLATGRAPAVHPAAMFLLIAFLAMSVVLKKAFCGWLCPVGTFSEMLWKLGRRFFSRNYQVPRWLDRELRGLKYLLLGFFVFVIAWMPVAALRDFMTGPYGTIADVKMLDFFRGIGVVGIAVIVWLVLLSVFIKNFWCRYLCPYGALMGLVSMLSPVKIRRDAEACIDCGKCSRACPSNLKIDKLVQIRSAECTACMACVAACPVENALQLALPPRKAETAADRWRGLAARPRVVAAVLAVIFFGVVLFARMTGHWQTDVPRDVYMQLVPHADEVSHPM
jgi:polyferredoxin